MQRQKIGVLSGGMSAEREVSILSGDAVAAALARRGYDVVRVFVDRDLDLVLRQAKIDVAFLALHGRYGEDGCVQGLLELAGVPYTGSGVLASALAMNKGKAKEILRLRNLPTPPYYVEESSRAGQIAAAHAGFGFPAVVKPCAAGSSVGVSIARDAAELEAACEEAFLFDDEVLIERYVDGIEVSVAILDGRALGVVEIAAAKPYDYSAKLSGAETHLPARLSPERTRGVLTQALLAHRALGCEGATRVDMIVSELGNEYVLEVNTIPPLLPNGLYPRIAESAGLPFDDLCETLLGGACLRGARGRSDRRVRKRAFAGPERRAAGVPEPH